MVEDLITWEGLLEKEASPPWLSQWQLECSMLWRPPLTHGTLIHDTRYMEAR